MKKTSKPRLIHEKIGTAFVTSSNAKLQIVGDAGHFTELEKSDEVSKVILDFLAE